MLNIYFVTKTILSIKNKMGTSLMTQWLRICLTKKKIICLTMQGTKVRSLSGELRPHIQWREGTLQ